VGRGFPFALDRGRSSSARDVTGRATMQKRRLADAGRLGRLDSRSRKRAASVLLGIDRGSVHTHRGIRGVAFGGPPPAETSMWHYPEVGRGVLHSYPRGLGARHANRATSGVTEPGLPLMTTASAGSLPHTAAWPVSESGLAPESTESPQERGLADVRDCPTRRESAECADGHSLLGAEQSCSWTRFAVSHCCV
jgi:hypothetical protein